MFATGRRISLIGLFVAASILFLIGCGDIQDLFQAQTSERLNDAKHSVRVTVGEGQFSENELGIISSTIDKIPGNDYLGSGGLILWKKDGPIGRSGLIAGSVSPYVRKDGSQEIFITLSSDFNPDGQFFSDGFNPVKTHRDLLQWVVVHEFGHLLSSRIFGHLLSSRIGTNYWLRDFAEIVGWEIKTEIGKTYKLMRMNDGTHKVEMVDEIVEDWVAPHENDLASFVRLLHRKDIEETFADYFAASVLYPELLSDRELRYFLIIHQGLINNPEKFIADVAADPKRPFKGALFCGENGKE